MAKVPGAEPLVFTHSWVTATLGRRVRKALDDEMKGRGPGASMVMFTLCEAMKRLSQEKVPPAKMLGVQAAQFRGTRDESQRAEIVEAYWQVVTELIKGGKWRKIPALEDQLPDEDFILRAVRRGPSALQRSGAQPPVKDHAKAALRPRTLA